VHSNQQLTWAEKHMHEEHHIYSFSPSAFFQLHDFDSSRTWSRDEVLRTYGLEQEDSTATEEDKVHVWKVVLDSIDSNRDGVVSAEEFEEFCAAGNTLPDFGFGVGHHGDDEYEYEIHHFEKYHDEYTTEEELTHPEDIEHFKKHEKDHEAEERQAILEQQPVLEQNIPLKFRPQT